MRKTSLKAFERVKKNLKGRKQIILAKVYQKRGSTSRDIAKLLKVPQHTISGRFTDLEKLGLIKDIGRKYYKGSAQPHTKWEVIIK
jgi:Mn-dependent DtxR family transcriptional regulator